MIGENRSRLFAAFLLFLIPAQAGSAGIERCLPVARKLAAEFRRSRNASTPVRGNPKAPITLTVFGDFDCPNTAKMHPVMIELLRRHPSTLRLIFKTLPIQTHPQAMSAARRWDAVRLIAPDKIWPYFDGLFQGKLERKLGDPYYQQLAQQLGLDQTLLATTLQSQTVERMIEADKTEAGHRGINAVPTFLLNGVQVESGTVPIEFLESDIANLSRRRSP